MNDIKRVAVIVSNLFNLEEVRSGTCFSQGKRDKCPGPQLNGVPQINYPLKKIYYFANFLQNIVIFCCSPRNLAIIFLAINVTLVKLPEFLY